MQKETHFYIHTSLFKRCKNSRELHRNSKFYVRHNCSQISDTEEHLSIYERLTSFPLWYFCRATVLYSVYRWVKFSQQSEFMVDLTPQLEVKAILPNCPFLKMFIPTFSLHQSFCEFSTFPSVSWWSGAKMFFFPISRIFLFTPFPFAIKING